MSYKFATIKQAIEQFGQGKFVIVVDDENRENEGDLVCPAELITSEQINFMISKARGLVCAPMSQNIGKRLEIQLMTDNITEKHGTKFTISVDAREQTTTGISASDRTNTLRKLASEESKPEDFVRPGHIFPLRARNNGVLRRAGHTEAVVDLTRLAGLIPGGALVEIMNEDGTMARLPQLIEIGSRFNIKIITIRDLIEYRLKTESLIEHGTEVNLPTDYGDFKLVPFKQKNSGLEHVALIKGKWTEDEPILVRVHSSCVTGDIFGSKRCDCGDQLHKSMQLIDKIGKGVIVYLNQEGRGIGLFNKIAAYKLQEEGLDTVEANLHLGFKDDERDYGVGAQILRSLGVKKMKLITNNPVKRAGLKGYGLEIVENVHLEIHPNKFNRFYLETKKYKMGHELDLDEDKNTK